jgi:hypothetical protein
MQDLWKILVPLLGTPVDETDFSQFLLAVKPNYFVQIGAGSLLHVFPKHGASVTSHEGRISSICFYAEPSTTMFPDMIPYAGSFAKGIKPRDGRADVISKFTKRLGSMIIMDEFRKDRFVEDRYLYSFEFKAPDWELRSMMIELLDRNCATKGQTLV